MDMAAMPMCLLSLATCISTNDFILPNLQNGMGFLSQLPDKHPLLTPSCLSMHVQALAASGSHPVHQAAGHIDKDLQWLESVLSLHANAIEVSLPGHVFGEREEARRAIVLRLPRAATGHTGALRYCKHDICIAVLCVWTELPSLIC